MPLADNSYLKLIFKQINVEPQIKRKPVAMSEALTVLLAKHGRFASPTLVSKMIYRLALDWQYQDWTSFQGAPKCLKSVLCQQPRLCGILEDQEPTIIWVIQHYPNFAPVLRYVPHSYETKALARRWRSCWQRKMKASQYQWDLVVGWRC